MAKRKDQPAKGPAWRAAEEYGIDMSLIEPNLRKTPAERIRANSLAAATAIALKKAMQGEVVDLQGFIGRFVTNDIDFVVIGDLAAAAYGVTHGTEGIRVCCAFSPDNLMRMQAALSDVHPVHRMPPARPPLELTPETAGDFKNLYLDTDDGQLDCLSFVDGVGDFEQAKQNSIEITLAKGACRVLSLDALIRSKEAMNRPRDRQAVLQLKAIRERLNDEPQ